MRAQRVIPLLAVLATLASCGGGSGGGIGPAPPQPPPFTSVPQARVSQASTFAPNCDGVASTGTLYVNTAAEPFLAVSRVNSMNFVAAWQQNRWSDGGAQGLNLAASSDGGQTWILSNAPFSRCTGGTSANGGDYARATDVWLSASPNGTVYALSLSFTGASLTPGSTSAMLVAQSGDGGFHWSDPVALIHDGAQFFNDKGSITADPGNASFAYAVWDRLTGQTAGPSYFAMTSNAGISWQAARSIYDPGANNQTLGNQVVVLPNGNLLDVFTELDTASGGAVTASVRVTQSLDKGTTWSMPPVVVSSLQAVGTTDPRNGAVVRDGADLVSVSVSPGGVVYVAWQDSRFSGGQHDGIAMTQSSDGGVTWSAPVQVNAETTVQAFTPTINVRAVGAIAVTYFDLRNNMFAGLFLTDCWMVVSSDGGTTFHESHLSGPFDLNLAPDSEGLFLGDYESLTSANGVFLPFYVQTEAGTAVRSDAFISFPPLTAAAAGFQPQPAAAGTALAPAATQRVMERIRLTQRQRLLGH